MTVLYKDYFTEEEAADYCCVSYSQFRKCKDETGIAPGVFMGKLLYRRTDLQRAIERGAFQKWQPTTSIMDRGTSSGRRTARGKKNASVEPQSSPNEKQN